MKVTVIAKTNATRQKIQVLGDHKLKVWVNSKPINGKANTEITQFLKKTIKKHIGTIPKSTSSQEKHQQQRLLK
jgi:uncharacterized protein YggU (UPF0235/DUF167 family)